MELIRCIGGFVRRASFCGRAGWCHCLALRFHFIGALTKLQLDTLNMRSVWFSILPDLHASLILETSLPRNYHQIDLEEGVSMQKVVKTVYNTIREKHAGTAERFAVWHEDLYFDVYNICPPLFVMRKDIVQWPPAQSVMDAFKENLRTIAQTLDHQKEDCILRAENSAGTCNELRSFKLITIPDRASFVFDGFDAGFGDLSLVVHMRPRPVTVNLSKLLREEEDHSEKKKVRQMDRDLPPSASNPSVVVNLPSTSSHDSIRSLYAEPSSQEILLEEIRALGKQVDELVKGDIDRFSDPSFNRKIPLLQTKPCSDIQFRGREVIKEIIDCLSTEKPKRLFLGQCIGAGGSFILGALASILHANTQHFVLYFSGFTLGKLMGDDGAWYETVTRALLIALSKHPDFDSGLASEIFNRNSVKRLENYVKGLPSGPRKLTLTFLVDDFDLVCLVQDCSRRTRFLDLIQGHNVVLVDKGCSPLAEELLLARVEALRMLDQIGESIHQLQIPASYTEREYESFRIAKKSKSDPQNILPLFKFAMLEAEFRRITGCVPGFVDSLYQSFKERLESVPDDLENDGTILDVLKESVEFSARMKEAKTQFITYIQGMYSAQSSDHRSDLTKFFLASLAGTCYQLSPCLYHPAFFSEVMQRTSHRYILAAGFLRDFLGDYIARQNESNYHHLLSQDFLSSTGPLYRNPAVLGAVAELRIIAKIQSSGFLLPGWNGPTLSRPVTRRALNLETILIALTDGDPVFFSSFGHSTPAIDGLYVLRKDDKVYVFGILVTIASRHKASEHLFFLTWESWIRRLAAPGCGILWNVVWVVNESTIAEGRTLVSKGPPEVFSELPPRNTRQKVYTSNPEYTRWLCSIKDWDRDMAQVLEARTAWL
ncbi:hypothetical protein VKT23_003648 [Stygiomarasmius scandens]|uniref:Uncharacterized protein n=1 Tax=Marasmiellus scandens TaxID=2682957 RepID=A0ABR1JXW2_9AGAR